MPSQKLLPGGLPVTLGCRFQAVLLQNLGHGAARYLTAQVGQRSLSSSIALIPVLRGHADDQVLDRILHPGTARATLLAAIILSGDQSAMPSQERLRRDDGSQFMKHTPAQFLDSDG